MHRTPARRLLVVALFLGATIAAVELISHAGLSVLGRRGVEYRPLVVDRLSAEHHGLLEELLAGRPSLFQHDAVLGWTLRPGFRSELCTIGSAAVRLVKLARTQLLPGNAIVRRGSYDADSEAFRVTTGLFTAFYEMALRDGAQPVILVFPERSDVEHWRSTHTKRYAPLLQFLATKGYRVVDAMTALDAAGNEHSVDDLIPTHFSPLANQLVAEHLLEQLRGFGLVR